MYNHFVWQADGFLHGRTTIDHPVEATPDSYGNAFFNDVAPVRDADGNETGQAQIPFPPLPAILLVPFVAIWGIAADQGLISIFIGALDIGIAFWFLGRMNLREGPRALVTVFIGAGSALWYAASIGSTWYFAHVVAVGLTFLSLGIALDADERRVWLDPDAPQPFLDWRQVLAGFLLGLAVTARLTVAFGGIFFVFAGGGRTWFRRGLGGAIGMAVPIAGLLLYTKLSTGAWFNPVYQTLYEYEIWAYSYLEPHYNAAWAISDFRYIPQNLGVMLTGMPDWMPACEPGVTREWFSEASCSVIVPKPVGMSFLLASPGYLLALIPIGRTLADLRFRRWREDVTATLRDGRVAGGLLAFLLIAIVNLMHFSQGWVQFGYRFSLDFLPFLAVPLALGAEVLGRRRAGLVLIGVLVAVSIAIQAWGIMWARTLGW